MVEASLSVAEGEVKPVSTAPATPVDPSASKIEIMVQFRPIAPEHSPLLVSSVAEYVSDAVHQCLSDARHWHSSCCIAAPGSADMGFHLLKGQLYMQRGVHQRHDKTLNPCTFTLCLQFRQLAEKKASRAAARVQA